MSVMRRTVVWVAVGLAAGSACTVRAQMAVIDAASIAQLVRQLSTMAQQLTTLQNQLTQEEAQYRAITGDRGMENLLSGQNRNYLPTDWNSLLASAIPSTTGYPALTSNVQSNLTANAVLTPSQVAALPSIDQVQLSADRQNMALVEATVQQALAATSARFNSLQQLIAAIGTAPDAKASLDLQARVAAEQAMVQNDQTKLQILYQAAQVQESIQAQRSQEQAIGDIGSLRALPAMGL